MFKATLNYHFNPNILAINAMAFFNGCGTLMIVSLLPSYMLNELHLKHSHIGNLEGIALFLAFAAKLCSGIYSDILRKRKIIIGFGTMGSLISKTIFCFANSPLIFFMGRSIDRISKGIRSAPTDALIADLSTESSANTLYSLKFAAMAAGNILGALLASGLFYATQNYQLIFGLAIIPSLMSLSILIIFVKDPFKKVSARTKSWQFNQILSLSNVFWQLMIGTFILMLARFSEAFINLRAHDLGWQVANIPLLVIIYELLMVAVSLLIGLKVNLLNFRYWIIINLFSLIGGNYLMSVTSNSFGMLLALALFALHLGVMQPLISSMISAVSPKNLKGTAFAIYYIVCGVSVLLANIIAGKMADMYAGGAFRSGLLISILATIYFVTILGVKKRSRISL